MNTVTKQQISAPIVRQYQIGGVRYIVKASVSEGASESAVTKINRLIQGDAETREAIQNRVMQFYFLLCRSAESLSP